MLKKFLPTLGMFLILFEGTSFASQYENYQLEKVLILSRHNIRSPMSGNDSALGKITPHKWFQWTSAPSELSLKGGQLETIMGQYFRRWLVDEKFMTDNYLPRNGEFRLYSNSKQRTIATTKYFSAGLLPISNLPVEYKFTDNSMDPVFNPQLTLVGKKFESQVKDELSKIISDFNNAYKIIEKTLDMEKSVAYKNGERFRTDDLDIVLEKNKEPMVVGSLRLATSASDALTLQYYEETDDRKAGFGHKLSRKDWEKISSVKEIYGGILFSTPSVAINVANPLLKEMSNELKLDERRFTFLCGHDSNIVSVLSALNVENYSLPNTIEKRAPIGVKFVVGKWIKDGIEYASLDLVYQSTEQIRNRTQLTLENPPEIFHLKFKDLRENSDGLYLWSDVLQRFQDSIDKYETLPRD